MRADSFDLQAINAIPVLSETVVIQQTGFGIAIYFDVSRNTNVASTGDHWMHGLITNRVDLGGMNGQFSGRLGSIIIDSTPLSPQAIATRAAVGHPLTRFEFENTIEQTPK